MNTSMANMKRHHEMMHKVARLPEAIVPLTPDSAQEQWVSGCALVSAALTLLTGEGVGNGWGIVVFLYSVDGVG